MSQFEFLRVQTVITACRRRRITYTARKHNVVLTVAWEILQGIPFLIQNCY